jgi:hypothetical protein
MSNHVRVGLHRFGSVQGVGRLVEITAENPDDVHFLLPPLFYLRLTPTSTPNPTTPTPILPARAAGQTVDGAHNTVTTNT